MLSLLADENISPEVVRQTAEKRPDIVITTVHHWRGGQYMGRPDDAILRTAMQEGLTLVTYDQSTILPLLAQWGQSGTDHAGVIFIARRSIASNNFGALVKALIALWDTSHADEWTNRVDFLRPV